VGGGGGGGVGGGDARESCKDAHAEEFLEMGTRWKKYRLGWNDKKEPEPSNCGVFMQAARGERKQSNPDSSLPSTGTRWAK